MIKKILVPLDGSEQAHHALNFALDVAKRYSADVVLLSVYHYVPIYEIPTTIQNSIIETVPIGEIPTTIQNSIIEAQKNHCEKVLSDAYERALKFKLDLNISLKLMEGRPADKIVETARDGDFDLIVMGSRGLSGIKELVLGSVSNTVADHATCPVLIVK